LDSKGQLYNIADDPGERKNVYAEDPEIVQRLTELLERYRRDGRSRPIEQP
jgi:arylsulfatase A